MFIGSTLAALLVSGLVWAQSLPLTFGTGAAASANTAFDGGFGSYVATAASGSMAFRSSQGAKTCFDGASTKCLSSDGTTLTAASLNLAAGNLSGTNTGDITLGAVGASPAAAGASLSSQVLTLQPASITQPGVVSNTTQSFLGDKTFSGNIAATNFSGTSSNTNSGDVTLAAIGASANANGASLSGQALTLQPASASFGGVLTSGTQSIAGAKTFTGAISATNLSGTQSGTNTGDITVAAIGSSANANGMTLTSQALNLEPASASFGGIVTTGTQTFAGAKTLSSVLNLTPATGNPALQMATGARFYMDGSTGTYYAYHESTLHNLVLQGFLGLAGPSGNGIEVSTSNTALSVNGSSSSLTIKAVGTGATNYANFFNTYADVPKLRVNNLGGGAPSYPLTIAGTSVGTVMLGITPSSTTSGDLIIYESVPAVTGTTNALALVGAPTTGLNAYISNTDNTNGTANATIEARVAGASGGDPKFLWTISGAVNWAAGLDNSDSDSWVLSSNTANLGTNNNIRCTTTGCGFPLGLKIGTGTTGTAISGSFRSTATLDFANQAVAGEETLTITVTGAVAGAEVDIGVPNGSVAAGSSFFGWVSAADTVSIKHTCTLTNCNPASGTFSARVWNP